MGYAIPIDLVKNLADNILYHCDGENMTKLNRALLGITISAKVIGPVIDENGTLLEGARVQVMEVSRTSLAYGKVEIDDIVNSITVDGVTVLATEVYVIPEHMLTARVGSVIVMNVTRGSETFDITFTITEDAITLER
jgi:S1-C subfamily serine protease